MNGEFYQCGMSCLRDDLGNVLLQDFLTNGIDWLKSTPYGSLLDMVCWVCTSSSLSLDLLHTLELWQYPLGQLLLLGFNPCILQAIFFLCIFCFVPSRISAKVQFFRPVVSSLNMLKGPGNFHFEKGMQFYWKNNLAFWKHQAQNQGQQGMCVISGLVFAKGNLNKNTNKRFNK